MKDNSKGKKKRKEKKNLSPWVIIEWFRSAPSHGALNHSRTTHLCAAHTLSCRLHENVWFWSGPEHHVAMLPDYWIVHATGKREGEKRHAIGLGGRGRMHGRGQERNQDFTLEVAKCMQQCMIVVMYLCTTGTLVIVRSPPWFITCNSFHPSFYVQVHKS